jgi:hypothetical protein
MAMIPTEREGALVEEEGETLITGIRKELCIVNKQSKRYQRTH